jgi:hypothetical protein
MFRFIPADMPFIRVGSGVVGPGKRPPVLKQVVQKGESSFALVFDHFSLVRDGALVKCKLEQPSPSSADLLSPLSGQVNTDIFIRLQTRKLLLLFKNNNVIHSLILYTYGITYSSHNFFAFNSPLLIYVGAYVTFPFLVLLFFLFLSHFLLFSLSLFNFFS